MEFAEGLLHSTTPYVVFATLVWHDYGGSLRRILEDCDNVETMGGKVRGLGAGRSVGAGYGWELGRWA